jgi:hypothetical protein
MKKILCIVCLTVLFSLSALADGGIELGRKPCTSNCLANPETQVAQVKDSPVSKSLTETVNDYFNSFTKYFIEISF